MSALEEFQLQGFLAPVPVASPWRARRWLKRLKDCPQPKEGRKCRAVHYPVYARLAREPRIVETVKSLIGDNVIQWGASLVRRAPGTDHPWHSDAETAYAAGKTVSVWIALSSVNENSGLQLISGSHLFGASVQELRYLHSVERSEVSNDQILAWARSYDPTSAIRQPQLRTGDAVFFDGRIWHGSINQDRSATRVALLLQYATPDVPIRVCESAYSSPYVRIDAERPKCIMISGWDDSGVNALVSSQTTESKMKTTARRTFLSTAVNDIGLPLEEDSDRGRRALQLSGGTTMTVDRMNYHASILSPGMMPHEPHTHLEEELLIMLNGEADLVMVPENITRSEHRHRLKAGFMVYYPAFYRHTIHNTGNAPATYLMFKWRASVPSRLESPASVFQYDVPALSVENKHNKPWVSKNIFSLPTRHLKRLHCHASLLQPGAGYDPHRDRYDVAILLLKGTVETLGRSVEPVSVVYYSAGEMHGLRNVGDTPAYYLVFEFHPGPTSNRWLRNGLQMRRIVRSPFGQITHNLAVYTALRSSALKRMLGR